MQNEDQFEKNIVNFVKDKVEDNIKGKIKDDNEEKFENNAVVAVSSGIRRYNELPWFGITLYKS